MRVRCLCLLFLLLAKCALARTGAGRIQGTVNDTSGAVVPGAKVTATHVPTGRPSGTTTNEVGFYLFPSAQNGSYSVLIEAAGMETFKGEFLLQIWFTREGVPLPTGAYSATARRGFETTIYGDIEVYQKKGWSNSQNFQFEIQRRYAKGYGFQFFYVMNNTLRAAGNGWSDDILPPTNVFMPGAVPEDNGKRARLLYYRRDTEFPKHRYNWNFIVDLPFGRDTWLATNAGPVLNRIIGG